MAEEKKEQKLEKGKKEAKAEVGEEKVLTINLRKDIVSKPHWKRTKYAVNYLRKILQKKTKSDKIVLDKKLNEKLWSKGIQNPDTKIRVKIVKDGEVVRAELMD